MKCMMQSGCGAIVLSLALVACSTPHRLVAVPSTQTSAAQPAVDDIRYVETRNADEFTREYLDSFHKERAYLARTGHTGPLPPAAFLAISGGGENGAFGAGLLAGWSGRPVFKTVTGVSTGALTAPFAFLGPKYDAVLREVYTTTSDAGIYKKRGMLKGILGDAMATTQPLQKLVERLITPAFLAEVAAEYEKGRLLLVGTTDLDARDAVVWNMTALAASNDPDALTLFRQVLVASAAIPGAFPPMMIDVTVNGQQYQEMHVDGGATAQVFIYPPRFHLHEEAIKYGFDRPLTLYVIRNAQLDADWGDVNRRTMSIATNAITSIIHAQGNGDLQRLYLTAQRDRMDYNLAIIPADFHVVSKSDFDPVYMRQLYARGLDMARNGYPWMKYPPGYGPEPQLAAPQPH